MQSKIVAYLITAAIAAVVVMLLVPAARPAFLSTSTR
jgi:hypothetical protein